MQESFQLFLPSLGKEETFVHNSMYRRNIDGEKSDHVMQASFSDLTHYFTMFLQDMTPKRSVVS